jgi:NDP-mannose synthase
LCAKRTRIKIKADGSDGFAMSSTLTGVKAVVLAGGQGTRLAPYTSVLPKPLMPIGNRAILEIVVEHLARCDLTDITFCVGHLAHLIEAVFESGASRGVAITYVREEQPMGTAGPIRLVGGLDDTFVALNGDVLTGLDLRDLVEHHRQSGNAMTVAATERRTVMNYGVLHVEREGTGAHRIVAFEEKPELASIVSMGLYVLEPMAVGAIPAGRQFDIPDLIDELIRSGERVGAYVYDGFWLDIGRHEDYERAVAAWEADEEFPFSHMGRHQPPSAPFEA